MRSYAFTVISHILGIVLSTGLLFYCVHEEIIFCPTFCGIAILYFSIHLYFIQMRQVKYWRYVVDCLRQQDLIQIVRSPYEDKVMRELADDLSAALRSLRGRLMDEEVRRQYFESLLNKVDTAVLVTDKEGAIEWKNRTADALLDTRCRLPNEFLEAIKAGKTVVRYGKPSVPQDWAIDATRIDLRGCERWIVSLKNIHSTLERNEMEAWQKLIRVLTHEIMNSITPVISLSETLSKRCKADPDDVRNRSYIQHGVNVIHRRSKGLLDFVENYRRLTRIASPVKTRILVKDFFSDLRRLCPEPSIRFRLPDEPLEWFADRAQMEQVFLNLVKNACEACAEKSNPEIIVAAQREGNELVFTVRDNGIGVLPEVIDRVFVPFFTTKPSGEHFRVWVRILICASVAFAPLYTLRQTAMEGDAIVRQTVGTVFDMWQKLAFTLVLVASFVLSYRNGKFAEAVGGLRFYGRMSLTNYIAQSVLGAFVYFPFGLYLAPHCGYTASLAIGLLIFLLQMRFCKRWLSGHRQGPLEYVWHRWTWLGAKQTPGNPAGSGFSGN